LDHVHDGAVAHGDRAVLGGDVAAGEGEGQFTQRVADGVHILAHIDGVRVAQHHGPQVALVDLQHGDVVLLLAAHQGGVIALSVGEEYGDVADAVDDMVVGKNVAGGVIGAD